MLSLTKRIHLVMAGRFYFINLYMPFRSSVPNWVHPVFSKEMKNLFSNEYVFLNNRDGIVI